MNSKAVELAFPSAAERCFFTLHLLKISVTEETIAIGAQEFLALIERNLAFLYTLGYPLLQLADEFFRIVLYVVQNFLYGLSVEYLVDAVLAVLHRDVGCIGVAEEIVHVAQDFLISSYEEHTEIIGFVLLQWMERKYIADMSVGHEIRYLAVAVAGDVLQGGVAGRTLVQALDRHDREELVDGPTVWQALEQ